LGRSRAGPAGLAHLDNYSGMVGEKKKENEEGACKVICYPHVGTDPSWKGELACHVCESGKICMRFLFPMLNL
jgi:hypothetical protein